MRPWPLVFMLIAWGFVLGLAFWCYYRLLRDDAGGGDEPRPRA